MVTLPGPVLPVRPVVSRAVCRTWDVAGRPGPVGGQGEGQAMSALSQNLSSVPPERLG